MWLRIQRLKNCITDFRRVFLDQQVRTILTKKLIIINHNNLLMIFIIIIMIYTELSRPASTETSSQWINIVDCGSTFLPRRKCCV